MHCKLLDSTMLPLSHSLWLCLYPSVSTTVTATLHEIRNWKRKAQTKRNCSHCCHWYTISQSSICSQGFYINCHSDLNGNFLRLQRVLMRINTKIISENKCFDKTSKWYVHFELFTSLLIVLLSFVISLFVYMSPSEMQLTTVKYLILYI